MNKLQAGFARVNVTPPMGIDVAGYFIKRIADGVLDELEINALALRHGESTVLLISMDNIGMKKDYIAVLKDAINERTGVDKDAIFISATHTHTGPRIEVDQTDKIDVDYRDFVTSRMADVSMFAIADLKDAVMGYGVGKAENIAFIRRYKMKDGSTRTNPGVNNPDIVCSAGDVDERVNVLRFDREGAETIVLANFGDHPDTIGGCKISADWPGFTRKFVEKAIDNTKCIFFNGAQGDVNHVNVMPKGGDLNGMFMDFDDVSRGYAHARHMGMVVAGAVMQVYEKVKYSEVDSIKYLARNIEVPANKATDEEDLKQARIYNDLHNAGKDNEIPFKGMMLTTVVAEAARKIRLQNAPDFFELPFTAITIGNVAMFGVPGEPFTGIGRGVKQSKEFELVLPCCTTNGSEGYYPMKDSYEEGGYEAGSSPFKAGSAEIMIEEGLKLLKDVKNK